MGAKQVFTFKTPKKVVITDPMYLEQMELAERRKRKLGYEVYRGLNGAEGSNYLSLSEDPEFGTYNAVIVFSPEPITQFVDRHAQVYEGGHQLSTEYTTMDNIIAVDSATLHLQVDDRLHVIHTGMDGIHGIAQKVDVTATPLEMITVTLYLDPSNFNGFDNFVQVFTGLFEATKRD